MAATDTSEGQTPEKELKAGVSPVSSGSAPGTRPSLVTPNDNPPLLSDRARAAVKAPQNLSWRFLVSWLGFGRPLVEQGDVSGGLTEASCIQEGYEPFCRIGRFTTFLSFQKKAVTFLVFCDGHPADVWSLLPQPARALLSNSASAVLAVLLDEAFAQDVNGINNNAQKACDALWQCLGWQGSTFDCSCAALVSVLWKGTRGGRVDEKIGAELDAVCAQIVPSTSRARTLCEYVYSLRVQECVHKSIAHHQALPGLISMGTKLGISEKHIDVMLQNLREAAVSEEMEAFRQACVKGHFPVVHHCPVALKVGETAHFVSPVKVLQQKTETLTHRTYIGTRIKLGKVPLYLGHSIPSPVSQEVTREIGDGTMVITNERVTLVPNQAHCSSRRAPAGYVGRRDTLARR